MYRIIVLCLFVLFLADSGCKTTGGSGSGAVMGVNYAFGPEHGCSDLSPEIALTGVPEGTAVLKARLKDLNVPGWNHGGGSVPYNGDGVIPEGALKDGYNGPCPPSGSHTYQFSVTALDAAGNVLATGKASLRYP